MRSEYDVAIIGGGPAGLSAALILGRARRQVIVIDDGHQRNRPVRESHGFLGHDGYSPVELLARAHAQLDRYSTIEFVEDQATSAAGEPERFTVGFSGGEAIIARRILFATGMCDVLPPISGIEQLWGKLVFVCPYCDGWEFRDRRIAVIGTARTGLELAQEMWNWSHDLVICATAQAPTTAELDEWRRAAGAQMASTPSKMYERENLLVIETKTGELFECSAAFVCAPLRQHSELPAELGCEFTERGTLRVDADNRTSVSGCYAAGDCITHHHQITFAAASGANAAIAVNSEFYLADAQALTARASRID